MVHISRIMLAAAGAILLAVSLPHTWLGTFGVPDWVAYPAVILFVVGGLGLLTGKRQFVYLGVAVIFICFGITMGFIGPAGISNPILMLMSVGNIAALVLMATASIGIRRR